MTADSGAPVLEFRGLSIGYRQHGALAPAVADVSFAIAPGEVVALVGESGSGKTTTARAIVGLRAPGAVVTGGQLLFDGTDILRLQHRQRSRHLGAEIGFVPQDPFVSLDPTMRIGAQLVEVLKRHRHGPASTWQDRAEQILEEVGIDRPSLRAQQYPFELSGGMRQRVLVGIALACRPRLVVADEPTSGLDVTVQRRVLDRFGELTGELGAAVLLITHDLAVASDRADRIVVMQRGRIVESGSVTDIISRPRRGYTRALLAAAPDINRPSERLAPAVADSAPPALFASGLSRTFSRGGEKIRAVQEVSLTIPAGRTLGLVGESGSGKTTTARIVAGLEHADAGSVRIGGEELAGLSRARLRGHRRSFQYVHQNPYAALDPRYTVEQLITEPLKNFGEGDRGARRTRVRELLEHVALPASFAERTRGQLSGGQTQRVAIARGLALNPRLLVLDEPVSALDVSVQAQILSLLVRLQDELGVAYLFISHDLSVIRRLAHDVAIMRAGRIVETGPVERVFSAPEHAYTRELLDAVPGRLRAAG